MTLQKLAYLAAQNEVYVLEKTYTDALLVAIEEEADNVDSYGPFGLEWNCNTFTKNVFQRALQLHSSSNFAVPPKLHPPPDAIVVKQVLPPLNHPPPSITHPEGQPPPCCNVM